MKEYTGGCAALVVGGKVQRTGPIARFASALKGSGIEVLSDDPDLCALLGTQAMQLDQMLERSRFAVCFGGDGKLLELSRQAAMYSLPVLGVNFGQLGFLTEIDAQGLDEAARKLSQGEFEIEERGMLRADCGAGSVFALNDIVVRRESPLAVIRAKVYVDNKHQDDYVADGLLVATTTGATAYALSCGGPIVDPSLDVMSFTPICPHSLRARSILMSPKQKVGIRAYPRSLPAIVCADGKDILTITEDDPEVTIGRAPYTARFIRLGEGGASFYAKVLSKLVDRTQ